MTNPIAIFLADIHLSLTPPVARSAEPDWLDAQARVLSQVGDLAREFGCPIICAGDLFDRWNSGPELISFAIKNLPRMYAIPGQHDLPHHRIEDIRRSAYWTLVEAGVIIDISSRSEQPVVRHGNFYPTNMRPLTLYGFPWGMGVAPRASKTDGISLAVVHAYCWIDGKGYPGAPNASKVGSFREKLSGYDVAVFGDNHQHFSSTWVGGHVWNCGCLIRRKIDEKQLKPLVGLLGENGVIKRHYLDCSEDKWVEESEARKVEELLGMNEFIAELGSLDSSDFTDFKQGVMRYIDNPDNSLDSNTKKVILEVLGD